MVFITGGNGLIGSYTTRLLLERGYPVRLLRRPASRLDWLSDLTDRIAWVEGDVLDMALLLDAIQPGDWVVHAAAIVSFDPSQREKMFKVNVEGTANVVNACLQKNAGKLCFVSSVAALGRSKRNPLIDENTPWEASEFNTAYAHSKYLAELEVWRGVAEGLPAVVVNPSVVLGPADWERSSTQLFKYAWEEHLFYPAGTVNYVDVRDVAEAIYLLLRSDIISEKFILNAGNITHRELLSGMAACFGKNPPTFEAKPWMAALGWRLEWLRSAVTGKSPLLTRETARSTYFTYHYSNDKVKNALHFSFRSLQDTLGWACGVLTGKYGGPSPSGQASVTYMTPK
jgi:nucleoside-diphosphate-sugar epimerase